MGLATLNDIDAQAGILLLLPRHVNGKPQVEQERDFNKKEDKQAVIRRLMELTLILCL